MVSPVNSFVKTEDLELNTSVSSSSFSATMSTSNSSASSAVDKIITEKRKYYSELDSKLEQLKQDIGLELFIKLTDEERKFIIETEGSVDLGYDVTKEDLERINKYIEEYED